MRFLLLILCSFSSLLAAKDFDTVASELSAELQKQNGALNTQRSRQFSERQQLQRSIAKTTALTDKKNKQQLGQEQQIVALQQALREMDRQFRKNKRQLTKLKKLAIQIRRESESSIPKNSLFIYSSHFKAADKSLESTDWGHFYQKQFTFNSQFLNDGFSMTVNKGQGINSQGEQSEAQLFLLGHRDPTKDHVPAEHRRKTVAAGRTYQAAGLGAGN